MEAKHAEHMVDTQRDISDEELDVLNNDPNEGGEDNPEEINDPDVFEDPEDPADSLNTNSRSLNWNWLSSNHFLHILARNYLSVHLYVSA